MAKGGAWEREISDTLSEWWSGSDEESLFWRTSQSGGRATVRTRKGKKTRGQHGDITSTDPSSEPMTRLFTIEAKRGYAGQTINELVDRTGHLNPHKDTLEHWIWKLEKQSPTPYWLLIHRRNKREALAYFPLKFYHAVRDANLGPFKGKPRRPFLFLNCRARESTKDPGDRVNLCVMLFEDFLAEVTPSSVKKHAKHFRRKR